VGGGAEYGYSCRRNGRKDWGKVKRGRTSGEGDRGREMRMGWAWGIDEVGGEQGGGRERGGSYRRRCGRGGRRRAKRG